jgi:GT2 family glycosyltransferase
VIRYTQGLKYEIILVDNASVECSPGLFSQKYPSVKLIKSAVNTGFTGGNNLGIEIAKGDTILLLNSDVVLNENSILKCFDVLQKEEKMGVVTCMLKYPEGSLQKQCQRFPSIFLTTLELFRLHKLMPKAMRGRVMLNGFFDHLTSTDSDSIWGTFFMFRKSLLSNFPNKKLPEAFFMYAEDLLWCYMIKKLGYRIYYLADTSVIHYSKGSSKVPDANIRQNNEYKFVLKYYGWFYAKVLVLVRSALYFTSRRAEYGSEISKIYFNLFLTGNVPNKTKG